MLSTSRRNFLCAGTLAGLGLADFFRLQHAGYQNRALLGRGGLVRQRGSRGEEERLQTSQGLRP